MLSSIFQKTVCHSERSGESARVGTGASPVRRAQLGWFRRQYHRGNFRWQRIFLLYRQRQLRRGHRHLWSST